MPKNGETNQKFGFYKNLCCGKEMVVAEGNQFPDCPNHPNLPTIWKALGSEKIVQFGIKGDSNRSAPRFQTGDRVRIVGPDANSGRQGVVVEVLERPHDFIHRYNVRFLDGAASRYFGFQLELSQSETKSA
jgi:hypothetical protein